MTMVYEDPRSSPPKAILAQGHTPILLCRAGLLRDKLGSSVTSWAPPRPPSKERIICLLQSIYARATLATYIGIQTNIFNFTIHRH
ncbi:hypothetical protein Syun_020619 [Stephania yunnanensis]|uniref:Uncharacterized protein n=1 Tax=Stephania yunnanensis TaxID=152371 RepID=A0AAP0IG23_9MAGN